VPFFREQSALFLREKCLKESLFCPKGTFENFNLCYLAENFFHFREKYGISVKFFGIFGKTVSYLGKNAICPEKLFWYVLKKIFEMSPPPPPDMSRKNRSYTIRIEAILNSQEHKVLCLTTIA
jgi:hypothetical protein